MKEFLIYLFQQFDWVFELHRYVFPDSWKTDKITCIHCSHSFLFDKEKISRTHKNQSGKIIYTLDCPFCSRWCFKSKDTLLGSSYFEDEVKMELIYMADGLFLYKTLDGYIVTDQNDNILKQAQTSQTCSRYISKTLQSRRAAEREAIEKINQSKV